MVCGNSIIADLPQDTAKIGCIVFLVMDKMFLQVCVPVALFFFFWPLEEGNIRENVFLFHSKSLDEFF